MNNCGNITKPKTRVYNHLAKLDLLKELPQTISDQTVFFPRHFLLNTKKTPLYTTSEGKLVFEPGKKTPLTWETVVNRELVDSVSKIYGMVLPADTKIVEFVYPAEGKTKYIDAYVKLNDDILTRIEKFAYEYPQELVPPQMEESNKLEPDDFTEAESPSPILNEAGQYQFFPQDPKSHEDAKKHKQAVKQNIENNLPQEVASTIEVVDVVPEDILGRDDLYLSMKDILEKVGITDPLLINWLGINKEGFKNFKGIKSQEQLEQIVQKSYNKKLKTESPEFKKNKLIKESFDNWVRNLQKYPLPFKDLMLKHAIKHLINPQRRNKYVLELSPVALEQTYGAIMNKPYELNRVGKIYDQTVLATVSDAVGHEPSASGNGYWVYIPKTISGRYLGYDTYEKFKEAYLKIIEDLESEIKLLKKEVEVPNYDKVQKEKLQDLKKQLSELQNKKPVFYSQEVYLDRDDLNMYGFQQFDYVRIESTYSRGNKFHKDTLGENYEGYYIHGYNTDNSDRPRTKILPITKKQAEDIWKKRVEEYPSNKFETSEVHAINNLEHEIKNFEKNSPKSKLKSRLQALEDNKKQLSETKPSNWASIKDYKVNVELLRKLSPSTWCTATTMADHYVQNYDNYLLIVNGVTVAGIEAYPRDAAKSIDPTTSKIKVKEVTSRANNGIAPIDYLDDILAFFEKHNLNPSNQSIQNAMRARENGKTDADVMGEYDYDPDFYPAYEPDYDFYEVEAQYEEFINQGVETAQNLQTVEETLDFLRIYREHPIVYQRINPNMLRNEQVVSNLLDYNPNSIVFIDATLPFYEEAALKAIRLDPQTFNYVSDSIRENPQATALYEDYLEANRQRVAGDFNPGVFARIREVYPNENYASILNPPSITLGLLDEFEREGTPFSYLREYPDYLPFSKARNKQIQGYYDAKTDKVVVVASNVKINEAAKVGIHEVAHRGMLRMAKDLGGSQALYQVLSAAKTQLMGKLPELLNRTGHKTLNSLILDYGFNPNTQEGEFKLLMELAARWAETLVSKPKPSWWKKLLQNIGQWLKQFTGITLNEDQVNALVGGFVQYGTTKTIATFEEEIQLSKVAPPSPIKPGVQELFESNPELANSVYETLGFKVFPKKGTKEYRDAEDILELEMMIEELGNEKLRGNFKFQDILSKANRTKGFTDKYVGWRKYFNVVTDMDTMIGIYGYINEKEGFTQSENTLQQLLQLIKNHVNKFKIDSITPQQKQQAQQLYSQYLDTTQNQFISPNDRVVFGHPTIGKSFLKKQGEDKFITLDDDYANEVNAFVDANRGTETRQEYKGRKPKEYNEFMLNLYDRLKAQAQREGKILFVSNTNILKERMSDFDKVITIPKAEFKRRFDERGATYGFEDWKSDIDATVAKVPNSKVITTTGYLADLFRGSQQDIEGFKEFVEQPSATQPTVSDVSSISSFKPRYEMTAEEREQRFQDFYNENQNISEEEAREYFNRCMI